MDPLSRHAHWRAADYARPAELTGPDPSLGHTSVIRTGDLRPRAVSDGHPFPRTSVCGAMRRCLTRSRVCWETHPRVQCQNVTVANSCDWLRWRSPLRPLLGRCCPASRSRVASNADRSDIADSSTSRSCSTTAGTPCAGIDAHTERRAALSPLGQPIVVRVVMVDALESFRSAML
jgi:hypothetical protein